MTKRLITILTSAAMLAYVPATINDHVNHDQRTNLHDVQPHISTELTNLLSEHAEPAEGIGREATPYYVATESELEEVARLVYLEARGESVDCQRAITEVIFNRLASGLWGDTLTDVIYAKNEFEPAAYISESETTDTIREMVYDVYWNGSTLPERILFFRADYYHAWYGAVNEFAIDNTYFSSSKWCEV